MSQDSIDKDSAALYKASFSITKVCNPYIADTVQLIDSAFHFKNQSDTGSQISYNWQFGDNTSSKEKDPVHSYNKPGIYQVSLIAYYKTIPADTVTRTVRIIIGQRELRSPLSYTQAIDIEEASGKDLMILASSFNQYGDSLDYVLIRTDSLLKERWRKNILSPGIRLNSIKKVSPNEFILAGNYSRGNTHQFALSKVDGNGNGIWTKYITNLEGQNVYVNKTSDGGLITIGDAITNNQSYCVVVKCDGNGTELWRKSFRNPLGHPHLSDAQNIVETATGYVFAGLKGSLLSYEIVITQLDNNGSISKQNSTPLDYTGTIYEAGIAAAGNSYMVNLVNTSHAFRFRSDLSVASLLRFGEASLNWVIAKDNHFFFAEGGHQYAFVSMSNENGEQQWQTVIDHAIMLSCTTRSSGTTRYCKKVIYSTSGDVVALSQGPNDYNSFNGSSVYIERFTIDGVPL
ncbi:MAG TPA: PKD domain-containing protein [Chitinophagaceae bacterium]|nr:PKD domain-containing protein [Chitinophagaceae bacterium]